MLPYSVGLLAVKSLLNVSITQYELLEASFESLQEHEILHKFQPSNASGSSPPKSLQNDKPLALARNEISLPFEYGHLSVIDSH